MNLLAAYRARADRALRTARLNLDDGDPAAAIDRAYYAAFYVATAALLRKDEHPRTHAGTHRRFSLHFIQTGEIAPEIGTTLRHAYDLRQRADYEAHSVLDEQAAANLLADVHTFVDAVAPLLES